MARRRLLTDMTVGRDAERRLPALKVMRPHDIR